MVQAIKSETMPMGLIGRFSPDTPGVILCWLMEDLAKFLNVTNTFSPEQAAQTASLILDDYECRNLKPEDFKVIFNGIKKGEYGALYNRLDGQVIFSAIRAYIERRGVWIEENNYREHRHLKTNEKSNLIAPEVVEMYKEILKNVKKAEEPQEPKPEVEKPHREKTPREKLVQALFREFYDLWLKKPYAVSDVIEKKFVEFDGKVLDECEYVEHRLKQENEHPAAGESKRD